MQFGVLEHETSFNAAKLEPEGSDGLGVGRIVHVVPFQRIASVLPEPGPTAVSKPTAMQNVVLLHVTPCSNAPWPPGLETIDHFVPFQRSISVRLE